MEQVSHTLLGDFLSRRGFSIVHVDAKWDGHRNARGERLRAFEPRFAQTASFGYVEADQEPAYAKEIGIVNVTSVVYYRGSELVGIGIGIGQDVGGNVERMMAGQPLEPTTKGRKK